MRSKIMLLGLSLAAFTACDGVLDVELPAQLTDDALADPKGAQIQVNTFINWFEEAFDQHVYNHLGREDGGEVYLCGPMCTFFHYTPENGQFAVMARSLRFSTELHDKLENEWTVAQVPDRAKMLAISSIYEGAVLNWMGSNLCEVAVQGGPLMSPSETLNRADAALTRALTEIQGAGGDFALQNGIATSARNLTYGLRAQVRWMNGNLPGAAADAALVPNGFKAWATRETGPDRRNDGWYSGTSGGFLELSDPIDWWQGLPNPVTGQPWGRPIPFTGYTFLGIMPDGRAVREDGVPIRTQAAVNAHGVTEGAIVDTRIPMVNPIIQGKQARGWSPSKLTAEGADNPIVNWQEMILIRAEAAGGQQAIDLVNVLRAADNLPRVTYASPGDAQQIRRMIIEERRRALFNEARFYYTKLKNLDLLWFPRASGGTRAQGHRLQGGIRTIMPLNEFIYNEHLTTSDRATLCPAAERPVQI
jgi:hypothetical protein